MLKHFWALPAFLRLALCSQASFSVQNDLLAFPQYEIVYSQSFISGKAAAALLNSARSAPAEEVVNEEDETYQTNTKAELALNVDPLQQQQQHKSPSDYPTSPNDRDTYERLILDGHPYLCTIPYVPPATPPNSNTTSTTPEEQEEELVRATNHGLELLQEMQKNCIYYKEGWWVYSFCYNEDIRQFHPLPPGRNGVPIYPPRPDPNVHNFLLGRFPKAQQQEQQQGKADSAETPIQNTLDGGTTSPDEQDSTTQSPNQTPSTPESTLQTRGETHYLVQKLGGGTSCDLTGLARRIEVQFHCNPSPQDKIDMVKETTSCVYLMVIHTPRLCNNVAFLPPQEDKPHAITCREILETPDEEAEWLQLRAEEAQQLLMQDAADQAMGQDSSNTRKSAPLIIGGVEVGAQRLVGSTPDLTIKPSNIMAALNAAKGSGNDNKAKPVVLATLAESDGKYIKSLEEKEMNKLGLKGTQEDINTWIKQMQAQAGEGVPWRLDVVRVDGQLQFLGMVGAGVGKEEDDDGDGDAVVKREESGTKKQEGSGEEEPAQGEDEDVGSQEEFL